MRANLGGKAYTLVENDVLERIVTRLEHLEIQVKAMQSQMSKAHKYAALPDWITKKEALEILAVKDMRTLNKHIESGLIRAKARNRTGAQYYSKEDCLNFAVNQEAKAIELSLGGRP